MGKIKKINVVILFMYILNSFIGTIRLQVHEHYILEAHPDDTIPDLRLDRPLPSFVDYCNSFDLKSLTREEHLHLPSLIILYKTLELWQQETSKTDLPRTRLEKDEFKKILDKISHHTAYDIHDKNKSLENFEEAKRTIPSRLVQTKLPSNIKGLFQDQSCLELNNQSNLFWFIIHAIKLFTENEGQGLLPIRGDLPDMITNTNSYIKLVEIYQEQAKRDSEIVYNYLLDLLKKYNRLTNEYINLHHSVQIYCKNASFLKILRTTAIKKEEELIDDTESDLSWFIGLHLCDLFYEKYNRYPGELLSDSRQFEIDLDDLKQINKKISNKNNQQEILEELCRYGASELHSIAAFIGGCCAQEAIKLITHQYIPIDNTLIYNGIQQSINVFKL
jgi:amyloid beta precursor protein binding protein 1